MSDEIRDWFITTDWFRSSECKVIAGPFSTREDALTAREVVERFTRPVTYCVDSRDSRVPVSGLRKEGD